MTLSPLDFFNRASDTLVKFNDIFGAIKDEDLDVHSLEVRNSVLNRLWNKTQETFDTYFETAAGQSSIQSAESKYDVLYAIYRGTCRYP